MLKDTHTHIHVHTCLCTCMYDCMYTQAYRQPNRMKQPLVSISLQYFCYWEEIYSSSPPPPPPNNKRTAEKLTPMPTAHTYSTWHGWHSAEVCGWSGGPVGVGKDKDIQGLEGLEALNEIEWVLVEIWNKIKWKISLEDHLISLAWNEKLGLKNK